MQTTLYGTASHVAIRGLKNLEAILDKAVANAEARKIDMAVLLNSRLAPDMFPLIRQVQIACDFAKGPMARLSGTENPKFEDTETTVPELKARIAKTLEFVRSIPEASFAGGEDRDIEIRAGDLVIQSKGLPYLLHMAQPNFYFHLSMVYAILRHNGVDVGKRDFIGQA